MENEKKEESKKEETVEQPTDQTTPVDEEKDSQKVEDTQPEGEEEVTLSKKELEDLRKRADDFNRSVELKRLSKLEKKESDPSDNDDVKEEIGQLRAEIQRFKTESHNSKLSEAYREFVGDNRWADEDNVFDKIKENFNSEGTETKEELLSKFKYAAQTAFPDKYEKHLEDKIKAKVLSEKNVDNSGGGASPVDTIHKDNKPKTQEDAMKDKMETLYKKSQPGR
jgi:hypothetical protein